jgi:hypothetical protein
VVAVVAVLAVGLLVLVGAAQVQQPAVRERQTQAVVGVETLVEPVVTAVLA